MLEHRPDASKSSLRAISRFFARGTAGALLLVVAHGCQAIIPSDPPPFNCSGTSLAACPTGSYCKGAGCAPCEASDVCDGFDNDCNGKIDDGDKNDADADGATICGRVEAGNIVNRDCDDADSTVNPAATEICNGRDDDCDGQIDESVCERDQICAPKRGCVPLASACDPNVPGSCPGGQSCDPGALACVGNLVRGLGDPCIADSECGVGAFCAPSNLLPNGLGSICTKTCCESRDCAAGFVCIAQGSGGNYCVKASAVGRPTPGSLVGGAACVDNTDCRSGVCDAKRCEDPCCRDENCTGGTVCRATSFVGSSRFSFGCAVKNGSLPPLSRCETGRCEKGACGVFTGGDVCVVPCCGSVGCGTADGSAILCRDVPPLAHPGDRVFTCSFVISGTSFKAMGEPCTSGAECRGAICQSDSKTGANYCSDLCCKDSDCTGGLACLPYASSGAQLLRCQRRT